MLNDDPNSDQQQHLQQPPVMIASLGASSSDWWSSVYYAIGLIGAFIVAVFTCVCNPKAKRFHKHKSFILPHDHLPNEVPLTGDHLAAAQVATTSLPATDQVDSANNKALKAISVHRALPDIPQPVAGTSAGGGGPVDASAPFSNSTSFADVTSTDDVDSLYTVANNHAAALANSANHPYARIRNHLPVDSSTENDTDDYAETAVRPAVASVQCHHHVHHAHEGGSPFRVVADDAYELEPQPHILRLQLRNNIEPQLFPVAGSSNETDEKKEISYNTISVREPLSKVLAEREANLEHHYNEVEDERVSSFYEEITTGSATYSKINDGSYGEPIASTSHHIDGLRHVPHQGRPPSDLVAEAANAGPLYSFVDKKMKRANLQAASISAPPPPEANNLYTMVVKSPAKTKNAAAADTKLPILQRYSPPPPLPPPLHPNTQPKLYRNTIMFGTPSSSSAAAAEPQQNIYHKISRADSEKDPGYETVDRNESGYEAILMDESDPAYEIVKPESTTSDDNNPAYETIKNETYSRLEEEELEDQNSEPNYEIIASTSAQINSHRPVVHLATHPGTGDSIGGHIPVPPQAYLHLHQHVHQLHNSHQHPPPPHRPHVHSPNSLILDENVIIEHL